MVRANVKGVPGQVFKEEQLKEIFRQHDANHDGLLSKAELKNAFKSLGALIPSLRTVLGLYHADANGDGSIGEE
jgi:Ca2+-binding EF-hand superfamily protein